MSDAPRERPPRSAQERVKAWRPQGFEGLEITRLSGFTDFQTPPSLSQSYTFVAHERFGSARMRYGGARYRYEPGRNAVWLQQLGELIHPEVLDDTPVSSCWLALFPEGARRTLRALGAEGPFHLPDMHPADALREPLARLITETVRAFDEPRSHLERETKLLGLTYAVLKHCSDAPPPEQKLGREHRAVALVKEVLHAHLERDLKLDDLESVTSLNKFYLTRVFQRDVGLSPHKYQTALRVHHAKNKLAGGEKVTDVARDLGFSDQAHFTHAFKRYTQTTPGRFRRLSLAQ